MRSSCPFKEKAGGRYAVGFFLATAGPVLLRFRRIYGQGSCKLVNARLMAARMF